MKQWLAYVFIIMFSFQVLPVKELGKMLFKGQITEEVHDCEADCPETKVKMEADPFKLLHHPAQVLSRLQHFRNKTMVALHYIDVLPMHFVPEILTPPPNCA